MRAQAMGKSTERATKETSRHSHASPFFKSGESRGAFFQPKLQVGATGDPYEHEADAVADRIMRMPEPEVQRSCAACAAGGSPCPKCEEEEQGLPTIHRKAQSPSDAGMSVPDEFLSTLGPGLPLDRATRNFMEPRFGQSFGRVRVHTGTQAGRLAQGINASAFTIGSHVVFDEGQFAPDSTRGQQLLAHELTHTVQQSGARADISSLRRKVDSPGIGLGIEKRVNRTSVMRQPNPGGETSTTGTTPPASTASPAASNPASCSGAANIPCKQSCCTGNQPATVAGDLARAIGYVDAAIAAVSASPMASNTASALDWYFRSSAPKTAAEVRRRLVCIKSCLADTQSNSRFGCDPDDYSDLAYVRVGSIPICQQAITPICVTNMHFGETDRVRAETIIHECAHRVGMSLGSPTSVPDIYSWSTHFRNLDTNQALQNSDSFARFAGVITGGFRLSVVPLIGVTGGAAFPGSSGLSPTWQARLYIGVEFEHPVLSVFNPTLGIGFSAIGTPAAPVGGIAPTPSLLFSLVPGIRIANPRPSAAGGPYVSLFGGPALIVGAGKLGLGAEAGVSLGYRWRWLDVSVGTGLVYDPTRAPGGQNLVPLTGGLTLAL
jgi:hypothetical protein